MIEFRDFSFQYPQSEQPVLQAVNLQILPGSLTLVAGPSGSGKSTLLRCLNGLVPHFTGGRVQGHLEVGGLDPLKIGPAGMTAKVGFVFQEPESQFVFDNSEDEIAFALENRGMTRTEMKNRLDKIYRQLKLQQLRNREISTLSGGEKQKVAIASALVLKPAILVLDEPTSQLDPVSADDILQYLVSLKQKLGLTIVISEHRLERLLPYTDRMIYLAGDCRVLEGPTREVLSVMENVPPVIQIARKLKISPLPITPEEFPRLRIQKVPLKENPDQKLPHTALLQVQGLKVKYDNQLILKDVSLALRESEILILMGPNGAGKTTLLRATMGLISSDGSRSVGGQDLDALSLRDVIKTIAYLPQNPNDLLFADSVMEEMKVTLTNHNLPIDNEEIIRHLSNFDLQDKRMRYPRDLSVGERQRTALAAITVHDPPIILLDEPTRGMDYGNKRELNEVLNNWRSCGKAILVVTHDIEFAAQLADRVVILQQGEITFSGSPQEAFTQFRSFQTQTSMIFQNQGWYKPDDVDPSLCLHT